MVGFYSAILKNFVNNSVLENGIGDTIQFLRDNDLSWDQIKALGFSDEEIQIAGVK